MIKNSITPQDVCDLLNEMLRLDPECVPALMFHREKCNSFIANHPTIQVHQYPPEQYPSVGIIGVLNGLFGIREDGMGVFCMEIEGDKLIGFKLTP